MFIQVFWSYQKLQNLREPGVEPGSIAWKATMLPLYHSRIRGSEPRAYQFLPSECW